MSDAAPYRVLLADDNPELRRLVRRALERTGRFEVVAEAGDGAETVDLAREHQPDLALCDLAMPVLDGLEALPLVRDVAPECTVVVISGFEAARMARLARERGASAYLVKGLSPPRLVAELLSVLQPEPSTDGARRGPERVMALRLGVEPTSPRMARKAAAACLCEWGLQSLTDVVELLVSELVTNSIVHAHSPSLLTMRVVGDRLHCSVEDWGPGTLVLREPSPTEPGGRGLRFVEHLSAAWGTAATSDGKAVWFDLVLPECEVVPVR